MRNLLTISVLLLITLPLFVSGQSDTLSIEKKTTITLSTVASSNANYYGQTAPKTLPFTYVDVKLRTTLGWYVSAGGYQLLNESNFPSEMHLSSGFEFDLSPTADFQIGYTRSFYAKASPLLQASNPNSLSSVIGVDHLLRTELTADYNFGQSEDIFISLDNSKNISLGKWGEKNTFVLKPGISIVAGTQRFYTTYIEERKRIGLDPILDIFGNNEQEDVETTTVSTDFSLLSYSLNVPLIYYRGNGALMLSYQLSMLSKKSTQSNRSNSFFSLGYFYQL